MVRISNGKKFGFRMVGSFDYRLLKRSVIEWIRYSNVRNSSPDCITFIGSMLKLITFLRYYIYQAYNLIVKLFYRAHAIFDLFVILELFRIYF